MMAPKIKQELYKLKRRLTLSNQKEAKTETETEVEIDPKFDPLKPLCDTEEQFKDLILKLSLLGIILHQVNEIFIGSLYAETGAALIDSSKNSVTLLQDTLIDNYIKTSLDAGQLAPVPEVKDISVWVEDVHFNIASQLYSLGFVESVVSPALATITTSIIEFAAEEAKNSKD